MKLIINILLNFASIVLPLLLSVLGVVHAFVDMFRFGSPYRRANHYFLNNAVALDIASNTLFKSMLNAWFLKHGGYHFGKRGETVSSALGKNQVLGTLTYLGSGLASILDLLQKDHCYISIDEEKYYLLTKPKPVSRLTTFSVLVITVLVLLISLKLLTFII